ncbi:MAG: hypothetical protein HY062_05725, partial [Bacteroidetes bacterium]|nr:hypothetical protein [Bacteroidota bacterium]
MQKSKFIISALLVLASWQIMDVLAFGNNAKKNEAGSAKKNNTVSDYKKYAVDEIVNIRIFSQVKVQS